MGFKYFLLIGSFFKIPGLDIFFSFTLVYLYNLQIIRVLVNSPQ